MGPVYEYVRKGRRPSTYVAAGVTVLMFAVGVIFGAPWWIWVVWLPVGLGLAYVLWKNPVSLIRIDGDTLSVKSSEFYGEWALEDIEVVEIVSWSDGPDTCRLDFGHGQTVLLPEDVLPPGDALAATLRARHVHVKRL